ncbi:MAG: hypothetical protein AAGC46_14010 [Solirubrobacteraceae bacterium]|nr:hypothetical protein [Patulibacter sp.]
MTTRGAAAVTAALFTSIALAACGSSAIGGRPAHRPISVIYVAGDPQGPWAKRIEGLTDGVKLAIAQRNGLVGPRAISVAVVPTVQRDGNLVSAGIGAGRIIRDSRALAVLGVYNAPELGLAAPQFNGGQLSLLQFGSGMVGLTAPEAPGEPDRYQPSGANYALRGVEPDTLLGEHAASIGALHGAQVVPITTTYRASLAKAAVGRAKAAVELRQAAIAQNEKKGTDNPVPSTSPALTNPSSEIPDAERIAARIAEAIGGHVVDAAKVDRSKPVVVVIDPTETNPTGDAAAVLSKVRAAGLAVDGADREFDPAVLGKGRSGAPTYELRRDLASDADAVDLQIRAKEQQLFGRDRGDAVIAGYRAAERILSLAARQPGKTIDRAAFATALAKASPSDPDLPSNADDDVTLGHTELFELRGGRWIRRR